MVSCVGPRLDDWTVTPTDDWWANVTSRSEGELDVQFADDRGDVLDVLATCENGVPVFTRA